MYLGQQQLVLYGVVVDLKSTIVHIVSITLNPWGQLELIGVQM